MEIAFTILGVGLTVLGLVMAYIWKSNGELQAKMMTALEQIEKGQERMQELIATSQGKLGEMLMNQTKILERIEGKL